jgi:hypothetical protein
VHGASSFHSSIQNNAAADPSIIDTFANFSDSTTSIRATDAWPRGIDSR